MPDGTEETASSLDETQTRLREGLDKARKLVEQARFMLGGESDESPA